MSAFLLPVLGAGAVLAVLCAGIEALSRRGPLRGERGRKALHVLAGTVTAALPLWLGAEQVALLALTVLAAFAFSRRRGVLRCVHGTPERGAGELVFCGAVAVVALTAGVGSAFVAAVLTLSYADAAAAVVGRRFGRRALRGCAPGKTWAGSVTCLLLAAAANAGVLVLMPVTQEVRLLSPLGLSCVLLLSAAAAVAEALPRRGWDNLTVPVTVAAGWLLLFGG